MKVRWGIGFLLVACLFACGGSGNDRAALETVSPPDSVLDRDTYKAVLAEALLIEAARKQRIYRNDNDSIRLKAAYDALFASHGISMEAFERSQAWWFGQPEAMIPLLQEVTESISDQERSWEAE